MNALFARSTLLTRTVVPMIDWEESIESHHRDRWLYRSTNVAPTMELELRGYSMQRPANVMIRYKHFQREELLKFDLLIDECLLVEVKACESIDPIHKAPLLSSMKRLDIPLGWIIHFNELKLADGISRLILPGANRE